MTRTLYCLLLSLCLSVAAFAQTFGDISGEVRDQTGAVVGGVAVTLTNTGTNATRTTESNDQGIYAFPALQPGQYTLKAEKQGFKVFTRTGIAVEVQLSARINIDMQVGSVSETIEVSAQAALLQSEN
ncbi:MAG: carboxypeptidase regulatory-like domain-containing protein, partial [Bryobacterales bacterium]|nr:carboxypeptidase regulatory-like domain-containing protein [Bryobacterales bacterium]